MKPYMFFIVNFRVQRDIPMPLVSSGVEHGNLRELALARMADLGTDCRDVRTREVGIQEIHNRVRPYEVRSICYIPLSHLILISINQYLLVSPYESKVNEKELIISLKV